MSRENKFYWKEGVTQREVEKSLSSTAFPRLRIQANRRILVVIHVFLLLVTALTSYWASIKNEFGFQSDSYLLSSGPVSIVSFLALLISYIFLRISIRKIADAPDELLDERFLQMRNRHFRTAYIWALLPSTLVIALLIFGPDVTSFGVGLENNDGTWLFCSYFFSLGTIPSMVVAWNEREI